MEDLTDTQGGVQGADTTGEYRHPLWTPDHAVRKQEIDAWLAACAVAKAFADRQPTAADTPEAAA